MSAIWVFIGGGLGSVTRYLLGVTFSKTTLSLPIATLCSNVLSCMIFALTLLLFNEQIQSNPNVKLFILTGICGGLSTFSTFSYETYELLKQQQYVWATSNVLISVFLCLLIFFTFIGTLN